MIFKEEIETARLAFQFMTRLPIPKGVPFDKIRMAQSIRYYPLVGVVIGGFAAIAYAGASKLSPTLAPILAIATAVFLTGALHEDGLADLVDGFWGGHTTERRLEIMRDSAIGSYGTLALIFIVLSQYVVLSDMPIHIAALTLVLGHAFSRSSVVVYMQNATYARRSGAGENLTERLETKGKFLFLGQFITLTSVAIIFLGWAATLSAFSFILVISSGLAVVSQRKIGGYTGDVLGALQQLSHLGFLVGIGCVF